MCKVSVTQLVRFLIVEPAQLTSARKRIHQQRCTCGPWWLCQYHDMPIQYFKDAYRGRVHRHKFTCIVGVYVCIVFLKKIIFFECAFYYWYCMHHFLVNKIATLLRKHKFTFFSNSISNQMSNYWQSLITALLWFFSFFRSKHKI